MTQPRFPFPNDEASAFAAFQQSADSASFNIDPQLLGSAATSPANTFIDPPLFPSPGSSPFVPAVNLHSSSPYPPALNTFWTTHHPSALRHQLLGHRRSVSQPPEDHPTLLPPGPAPPVIFSRGDLKIGETTHAPAPTPHRRPLVLSVHSDRNANGGGSRGMRHHPYPTVARDGTPNQRYHLRRTQTQPGGFASTSAPMMPSMQGGAAAFYPVPEMQAVGGAVPASTMLLQSPMEGMPARRAGGQAGVMERVKEAIGTVLEVVRRTEQRQMERIGAVLEAVGRMERRQMELEGLVREVAACSSRAHGVVALDGARDEQLVNGQATQRDVVESLEEYDVMDALFEDGSQHTGIDGEMGDLFGDLAADFCEQMAADGGS